MPLCTWSLSEVKLLSEYSLLATFSNTHYYKNNQSGALFQKRLTTQSLWTAYGKR